MFLEAGDRTWGQRQKFCTKEEHNHEEISFGSDHESVEPVVITRHGGLSDCLLATHTGRSPHAL